MTKETLKPRSELTDQERGHIAGDFVAKHMFINQNSLVEMCLANDLFVWDDVENMYAVNDDEDEEDEEDEDDDEKEYGREEAQEIYSWILVESFMANKLSARGEPILTNDYGTWWGRTCCGQAYSMDTVIQEIALGVHYA